MLNEYRVVEITYGDGRKLYRVEQKEVQSNKNLTTDTVHWDYIEPHRMNIMKYYSVDESPFCPTTGYYVLKKDAIHFKSWLIKQDLQREIVSTDVVG